MPEEILARLTGAVVAKANRVAGLAQAQVNLSEILARQARNEAERVRAAEFDAEVRRQAAVASRLRTSITNATSAVAPGGLSEPWSVTRQAPTVDVLAGANFVRCGAIKHPSVDESDLLPLILPFLDHGNIGIVASGDRREKARFVIQEIVLRTLLGSGPGQVSVVTFDPKLSGDLALFTPLRQASEEVIRNAFSSVSELRDVFEALTRDVRRITDMYGGAPYSLGGFRRSTGQPVEHYQVVVLLDYPYGFDTETQASLVTLLRAGPACGVSFIVHYDSTVPVPRDVEPLLILDATTSVDLNTKTVASLPGYSIRDSVPPSRELTSELLSKLGIGIKGAAAPTVAFRSLQVSLEQMWTKRSADQITATIGITGHHPIEVTLGDEVEQKHNVLVTGAVGQGKSNLLMALIHSWAMNYSPSEIEFFLLDFKDGVTLFPLADHGAGDWLPHARVVGLESDRQHGVAVLQYLVAELERRARIIKPYGDNIARYRKAQPDAVMPRMVAVIDEFQVLFEIDDEIAKAALLALERLAKRGRAFGIHLVLASQTLSGITAMLAKQDGIFGQFPIRLALYNSAAESRAVLAQNNLEASRLRYRGEVVVNKDFGETDGNQRGVVAFADSGELRSIRKHFVAADVRRRTPSVFNGGVPANVRDYLLQRTSIEAETLLGVTIDVDPLPFKARMGDENGRHVSILGSGKRVDGSGGESPVDALSAAALSIARSAAPGAAKFVVLDLLGDTQSRESVRKTVSELRMTHETELVESREVASRLATLAAGLETRRLEQNPPKTFVLGYGMDRLPKARMMDFATGAAPIDGLIAVWRDGGSLGVHFLGWWSNVRIYNDHVGIEAAGLIDVTMAFKIPQDAVVDLFGPFFRWDSPDNRAVVRDVSIDNEPSVVIPFGDPVEPKTAIDEAVSS